MCSLETLLCALKLIVYCLIPAKNCASLLHYCFPYLENLQLISYCSRYLYFK